MESIIKGDDPKLPATTCLECANLHEVLQHEAQECAMFQSALEQIVEEDADRLYHASECEEEATESFAGKTASDTLAAHAAATEQFDHRRRKPLPEPDDDDIPF